MSSIIKVDTVQDQDGNNIINENADTITIGASGDTITIPAGATLANSGIVTGFESTGIDDNATSTAITIDSSENIGIGTASPSTKLHVVGDYGNTLLIGTSPKITVQHSGGTNQFVEIQQSGAASFIGTQNGTNDGELYILGRHTGNNQAIFRPNSIELYTAGSERMRIDSGGSLLIGTTTVGSAGAGDLSVNGGIFLGGTGTANKLDDYEEGDWTPTFISNTGASIYSGSSVGKYTKIGRAVTISARFPNTHALSGTTSYLRLSGLPFACINVSNAESALAVWCASGFSVTGTIQARTEVNQSELIIQVQQNGSGSNITNSNFSGNLNLDIGGVYFTS